MEPLLTRLQQNEYELIMINSKEMTVPKGEYVFVEGEEARRIFFIMKGEVRVFKRIQPEKEITIFIRGARDCIGEIGIFSGDTYSNSALATEDTKICYMEKNDMEILMKQNGHLGLHFTKWVAESLEASKAKLRDYLLYGSEGAVASFFIRAGNLYGKEMPRGILVKKAVTAQEIASFVGISRETVSRILSKWREQNIIERTGRYYFIKNIHYFREMLYCDKCGVHNCVL